jgi:hypothetical protein
VSDPAHGLAQAATAEGFEKAWPDLLRKVQEEQALRGQDFATEYRQFARSRANSAPE